MEKGEKKGRKEVRTGEGLALPLVQSTRRHCVAEFIHDLDCMKNIIIKFIRSNITKTTHELQTADSAPTVAA